MSNRTVASLLAWRAKILSILDGQRSAALRFARLGVGLVFVSTGWGKVHNIPKVIAFFQSLGIPAAELQAPFVAYTELLCGSAIVIGLCSRLAAIPLVVSMVVAILTAKRADLHGLFDLVGFDEFTYIVLLVVIAVLGPGNFAVDKFIAQRIAETEKKA
jgi:putative oxidoreductase